MERMPCDDNPKAEKRANGVCRQLRFSLQLLASLAHANICYFPTHFVVRTDEMA
jgi:hypothetical protein